MSACACLLKRKLPLLFAILSFAFATGAYAEPAQRGLLSATGSVGYGDVTIPDQFEGEIGGGVSLGKDECSYSVTNTSKDTTYKFSVELNQFSTTGKKSLAGSGSHTLKPGESDKRSVRVKARTSGCALWITRWKGDKKEEPEEESEDKKKDDSDEGTKPAPQPTFNFDTRKPRGEGEGAAQDKSFKLRTPNHPRPSGEGAVEEGS